jgi:RNA polymerase sigma-70 factor (ECF subfamily)
VSEREVVDNVRVDVVFRQQVELLQRVAVGMGLSAEQGRDVLQDVYLEAFQRPPKFQGSDQAKRWLIRVTVNRCLSEFRRKKRHDQKAREMFQKWAERERAQVGPDQQAARHEQMQAVREGLRKMSELLRTPLVLKYYCGLNASEIGKVLELKPGTVRKRLCDGRIALAKALLQRGIRP